MAIRKFNLREFRVRTGREAEAEALLKTKEQSAFRKILTDKKITLVPLDKKIPNHQVTKIKQIEKFAKTDNFWNVFISFQEIPGVRKMRTTANPIDYSNVFKTTVLVVQAFFKKTVYTKGFVDFKRPIRNIPNLPDNFNDLDIDFTCAGLLEYIDRFEKIRNDPNYFPKNKTYLKSLGLAEFIFGGLTSFATAKPILLTHCISEPKTLFQDPDESATRLLKKIYGVYISKNKLFDYTETKGMALLATRIVEFSKVNNVEPSKFFEEFFKSLGNWKGVSTNFLFTNKMFSRFTAHLKKVGYSLKEEQVIEVKVEPVVDKVLSPIKRRKELLIKDKRRKKEAKKKINKPMTLKSLESFFN